MLIGSRTELPKSETCCANCYAFLHAP
ncbi:hypothetical protein CDAR_250751, partial [Caerostris darwini]